MEEPSVLDFVKAKLTFWKKSDLRFPSAEEISESGMAAEETPIEVIDQLIVPASVQGTGFLARFPWMALLALVFALTGQLMIEPPGRNWQLAMVMYMLCAIFLGIAFWQGQIRLTDPRPEPLPGERPADILLTAWMVSAVCLTLAALMALAGANRGADSGLQVIMRIAMIGLTLILSLSAIAWGMMTFSKRVDKGSEQKPLISGKVIVLIFGIVILLFVTILSFNGNLFTRTNLALWLVSIAVAVVAVAKVQPLTWWPAVKARISQPLTIRVDLFVLLLLVVIGIAGYFRLYNLNGLPGEMFSDQAEKLYDINDVLNGKYSTFFERNTGRELFQFYWTALMAIVFNTGISFMSLKIGTVIAGLITLYFMYRLGDEVGGKWVGLYALFFTAIAYWPNIISRIGLRFPLYPFCVAPVFFYLLRGVRREERNDFIWAGIWLGIGLHGYTASRIVPLAVLLAFGLYLLHKQSKGKRGEAFVWLGVLAFISFVVFIPLYHYALDNPAMFNYRALTRMGSLEQPLPGPAGAIFVSNIWNALTMFFWNNGDVWVHSIPGRPALGVVDAAFFFIGIGLLIARYIKRLYWRDLFLVLSIPVLLLPSILSLAFPNENPNLNRTAGVYVVVFLVMALGFDAFVRAIWRRVGGKPGMAAAVGLGLALAMVSLSTNYNLFFVRFAHEFNTSAWNTTEMGTVMRGFSQVLGTADTTWVVGYPHWVDTRLVGINAGYPERNPETFADRLEETFTDPRAKLYMLNTADAPALDTLRVQFPEGRFWLHKSPVEGKDFIVFMVPAAADTMP